MKVFISYSHRDIDFVKKLKEALEVKGIGVTIDIEAAKFGDNLDEFMRTSVHEADFTVSVVSENSLKSVWVVEESLRTLMHEEVEGKKRFLPIYIDTSFLDDTFYREIVKWIDESITTLQELTNQAIEKHLGTKLYDQKRERLLTLRNNLDTIFTKLTNVLVADFSNDEKFHENLPKLISTIKEAEEDRLAPLDFKAEIEIYSRGFVGRQWVNDIIDHWLESDGPNAFVLVAEPGFGKSAIAAWLYQSRDDVVGIHFCSKTANERSLNPYEFIASLDAQLHVRLPGFAELLKPRLSDLRFQKATGAFREMIVNPLHNKQLPMPPTPQIIIIDALDENSHEIGNETILNILRDQFHLLPPWLRIIATTQPDQNILNQLGEMYIFNVSTEMSANSQDLRDYVRKRLDSMILQLSDRENSNTIREKIELLAKGNFLYAVKVLDALENSIFIVADLEKLPSGLSTFYNRMFEKQFSNKDEYTKIYNPLFSVFVASRAPLPINIIEHFCHGIAEQLFRIRVFLKIHENEENPCYTLYHNSLKEWLTNRLKAGQFYVNPGDGEQLLADFGMQEFENGVEMMSKYSKEHLPIHLSEIGRWKDLVTLIGGDELNDEINLLERWTEKGHSDEGLICLKGIIDYLRRQNTDLTLAAGLSTQIARIYSRMGEFADAERHLKQALKMASWSDNRRIQAVAYHEIGSIYLYRGDREAAAKAYSKALDLCIRHEPVYNDEAAANLLGLATIRLLQYRYDDVFYLAGDALQKARDTGDIPHTIAAHRILANAYKDNLQYNKAEQHLQMAKLLTEIEDLPMERITLFHLKGWIYYTQAILNNEPLTHAIEKFESIEVEAKRVSYISYYISAKLGLVWCALARNDSEKANELLEQVEDAAPSEITYDLEIRIQLGRAMVSHQFGYFDKAEKHYKEAIKLCQRYEQHDRESDAWVGLGSTYWHRGYHNKAESYWKEAIDISGKCSPARSKLIKLGIKRARDDPKVTPL